MCGCDKHRDPSAECTCVCYEHGNFKLALKLASSRCLLLISVASQVKAVIDDLSLDTSIAEVKSELEQLLVNMREYGA